MNPETNKVLEQIRESLFGRSLSETTVQQLQKSKLGREFAKWKWVNKVDSFPNENGRYELVSVRKDQAPPRDSEGVFSSIEAILGTVAKEFGARNVDELIITDRKRGYVILRRVY